MSNNNQNILARTESYLRQWYQQEMPASFVFHNFHYTQDLVKAAEKLAQKESLPAGQVEVLSLASWFQYTGLAVDKAAYSRHSAQIAGRFLTEQQYDEEKKEQVLQLIRFDQKEKEPADLLEKILYDARHLYLGSKDFFAQARLLRIEKEEIRGKSFTEKKWSDYLLSLLRRHNYYTTWAQKKHGKRKLKHLARQKEKGSKAREKTLKKKTGKNIGRGVDTLYRTGFRNHINLSQIADGKANMMISINTIVLSILIAVSGTGLSSVENFVMNDLSYILPVLILLLSSLTALVFAVFSAKPTVTGFKLKKGQSLPPGVNMLYFGNFLQLEREEFVEYLSQLKTDQNHLYDDLARDLYNLGLVLQKKYRLLSYSYNIFVGGLVLGVLTFITVFLF